MLHRQTKQILWFSVLILCGLSLYSCDKQDEPIKPNEENIGKKIGLEKTNEEPKQKEPKQKTKPNEKPKKGEDKVIIKRGFFRYEVKGVKQTSHPDYLEIEIVSPLTSLNPKASIRLIRNGNESYLEGFDAFMEKYKDEICGCAFGYIDRTWLIYEPKAKKYSLMLPKEGSDEYVDMVPIRDVLSIDYNQKQDVLIVKLKTPLQGKVGEPKTYRLKRVEKSIIPEGGYDS